MFERVKGMVDYYPEDREVFVKLSNLFRQQAVKYGFKEIAVPAIESLGLLAEKEGEEIKEQIFTIENKGGEKKAKEELGLIFDITVPAVRMFISKQKETAKPVKWFYIDRMWRYERPQKGRLREFYQFGVEVFGSNSPRADAEIISLAIDSLRATGLTEKDFVVKINNRDVLEDLLKKFGVKNIEDAFKIIDKGEKITQDEFREELKKAGIKQVKEIENMIQIKDISKIPKDTKGLENLKEVFELLKTKKDFIELDLSTARGLAYYTGTVFEIFDKEMKYRALCGGGRYDRLVKMLKGDDCPATGFGIGFATLTLLLDEKMLLPDSELGVDYYIATIGNTSKEAIGIAEVLRKNNKVDINLIDRSLSAQLDCANAMNAKKVVIVGEKDLANKEVTVKDMESGKDEKVKINKLEQI